MQHSVFVAMGFRLPKQGYVPPSAQKQCSLDGKDLIALAEQPSNHLLTTHDVDTNTAVKTPQVTGF